MTISAEDRKAIQRQLLDQRIEGLEQDRVRREYDLAINEALMASQPDLDPQVGLKLRERVHADLAVIDAGIAALEVMRHDMDQPQPRSARRKALSAKRPTT